MRRGAKRLQKCLGGEQRGLKGRDGRAMEHIRCGNGRGITAGGSTKQGRGRDAKVINHKCTEMYIFLNILSTIERLNDIRNYKK